MTGGPRKPRTHSVQEMCNSLLSLGRVCRPLLNRHHRFSDIRTMETTDSKSI